MSLPNRSIYPTIGSVLANADRLNLLYSPFRSRVVNPEHYDEKIKFWIRAIEEFGTCDSKITFSIKDLQTAFIVEGRKTVCLMEVINHLRNNGRIITKDEFYESLVSCGWIGWTKWGLKKLWSFSPISFGIFSNSIDNSTRLVFLPILRVKENRCLDLAHLRGRIKSEEEWKADVSENLHLSVPEDIDILYEHMKHTGNLATIQFGHKTLVKMMDPLNPSKTNEITPAERSEYDISNTISALEKDLHRMYDKQSELEKLARKALQEQKRSVAKHHLRNKKLYEKRAIKLNDVLDNLQTIQLQIEDCASDVRIVQAYEAGKKALDQQLKENNLTTDRVTEVMLDLQDVFDQHNDITASISQPIAPEDSTELEEELAMLLNEKDVPELEGEPEAMDTTPPLEDQLPSVSGLQDLTSKDRNYGFAQKSLSPEY